MDANWICPHTGMTGRPWSGGDEFIVSPVGSLHYLKASPLSYDADYFLTDYKKQYGKSYLDDSENLRRLARRRLSRIKGDLSGKTILEFGCASGFFLDEARMMGLQGKGVEISDFASRYARDTLQLDVEQTSFEAFDAKEQYDFVAAFFVLEHIADQKSAFEKIEKLLKPGGQFLFAVPSTNGPLFHCHPDEWIRTHPADHFADYSPESLAKILPFYGMQMLESHPMSYRKERSCGFLSLLPESLYRMYADWRTYGDTLEGLAVKRSGSEDL